MNEYDGWELSEYLLQVPRIGGRRYRVACRRGYEVGCYLVEEGMDTQQRTVAFIDRQTYDVYSCTVIPASGVFGSVGADAVKVVRMTGLPHGSTGQVTIRQPDGRYRRYSRWDRIVKRVSARPHAVVRTVPQCGCGGYLGVPMLFDSFTEMAAYFFVVFSDAKAAESRDMQMQGRACDGNA